MKKAIIVLIIFAVLAISLTYFLINAENKKSVENSNIDYSNNGFNQNTENTDNKDKEEKSNNLENKEASIILGESTYFENPINLLYFNEDNNVVVNDYEAEYFQIDGIKNSQVQSRINDKLKNDRIKNIFGNFSNIISVGNYQKDLFYNLNLINGEKITIEDYIDNKQNIKNKLPKYFYKAITESFYLDTYLFGAFKDDFNDEYFANIEKNLIGGYSQESREEDVKTQKRSKELLAKFNEQIELWQIELLKKFENDEFDFYFDLGEVYLIFRDCSFVNPIDESQLEFPGGYVKKVDRISVRIPLYEIYENVIVFSKYADNRSIYENDIGEEKYVGLWDFKKTNNILSFDTGDIEKINLNSFNGFEGDFDKLKKANEKWNEKFEKLKQIKDKKIIAFNKQCGSQMGGSFLIQYYLLYDESVSSESEQQILTKMMQAFDVSFESQLYDSLVDVSNELKQRYPNIEYDVEQISVWSEKDSEWCQKDIEIKNKNFSEGDILEYFYDTYERKNELSEEEKKEFEFFEKYVSNDEIDGDGIFSRTILYLHH